MATAGKKAYRVILCEDDHSEAQQLARFLESSGFETPLIVPDGRQLITSVRNAEEPVDAIVLDIIMPVLDGFAAFWELKQLPNCPPIIFVSAENSVAVAKYLLENGAADYITKPYNRGKLLERLTRVLERPTIP